MSLIRMFSKIFALTVPMCSNSINFNTNWSVFIIEVFYSQINKSWFIQFFIRLIEPTTMVVSNNHLNYCAFHADNILCCLLYGIDPTTIVVSNDRLNYCAFYIYYAVYCMNNVRSFSRSSSRGTNKHGMAQITIPYHTLLDFNIQSRAYSNRARLFELQMTSIELFAKIIQKNHRFIAERSRCVAANILVRCVNLV